MDGAGGLSELYLPPPITAPGSPPRPHHCSSEALPGVPPPQLSVAFTRQTCLSSQGFCTLILHLVFLHSDEMIYSSVEDGDEESGHSSLGEVELQRFESYEEQSDSEARRGPRSLPAATTEEAGRCPGCVLGDSVLTRACGQDREGVASFM